MDLDKKTEQKSACDETAESTKGGADGAEGAEGAEGAAAISSGTKNLKFKKSQKEFWRYMKKQYGLYLMVVPGFVILFLFTYLPMYGITLAFKSYSPRYGIFGSKWIGFDNFKAVFSNSEIMLYIRNTLFYGVLNMVFVFPIPIILSVLMNELLHKSFKSVFQTLCYLPYFLSWAVVGMILYFLINYQNGTLNALRGFFNLAPYNYYDMYARKKWPAIITVVAIWKTAGWGTIMYLAAFTGISMDLYEAAEIDGANRWQQVVHITLAGIMPTVCITFILNVSSIVKDNYEMMYALVGSENHGLAETTEVLGSYVYRLVLSGSSMASYGYGSAATLLQSIIAVLLMFGANKLVTKLGNQGIF
jgi:putative aldouronate transport system permease protein